MPPLLSVFDVFTPTTQARVNFVDRPAINDQLVDALSTPGKQLIVYGETGSGKSTLLLNKLEQTYAGHVTSRCSAAMTFEQLILDGFDHLSPYYVDGRTTSKTSGVAARLESDFLFIKASLDATRSATAELSQRRMLPPQLTPQRLGEFLGAHGLCWLVEDFHKMPPDAKLRLAQSLKVFSDLAAQYPDVRIIAVGATDTARQVVEYDREMFGRVSELLVPLMNEDELTAIITNGQRLLKVDFGRLAQPIAQYAVGVASVCHQLALNVCLERHVRVPAPSAVRFSEDDLKRAMERYVRESSDTLKAAFDAALMRHRVRKYDNCREILTVLATGPLAGMRHSDILARIRETHREYPPANLTVYLRDLTTERRGNLLRSSPDGNYRFADPLHHTFAQATLLPGRRPRPETELNALARDFVFHIVSTELAETDWKEVR